MLQLEHQGQRYAKPVFASGGEVSLRRERIYRLLGPVHEQELSVMRGRRDLGDSGEMSLDEFASRYLETRDQLAVRNLRGEPLSHREQSLLSALNEMLDQLLPSPERVRAEILELADEVLRRRNG